MFKKIFLVMVCLVLVAIPALAEFDAKYDKGPDCFMTIDEARVGTAFNGYVIDKAGYESGRNYIRNDGKLWRERTPMTTDILLCGASKTVEPVWICPEVAVITKPKLATKTFVVYFDFDKSDIRKDQEAVLNEAVTYAEQGGAVKISLSSFCDFRGSTPYNKGLGQRRVDAVKNWFDKTPIEVEFVTTNNGKLKSLIKNLAKTGFCKECWSDRRVEITIE